MDIWVIWEYSASVTVIGLLIWLIKLIFHDKLDARWHYYIWLVLLARVLVPVHVRPVPTPLSIFQEIPLGKWMEMGRILAQEKGYAELCGLLGRAYLWGAGLLGAFYLAMWAMLRLQVALAPKADRAVREYVEGIAAKYGCKGCRDIRVRRSPSPYVCGLVHPVLVIPGPDRPAGRGCRRSGGEAPVPGLPGEQVILHELLHKRHRDVLVNILVHGVRVVNWFNPLVWLLTAGVLNDSEALCDQRVLEHCGGEMARDYGELLIGMGTGRNPVRIGTSNMAGSYRDMKIRIRRIRDFKRVPGKIGVVTLCITLILAVSAIGSAAEEGQGFPVPAIGSEKDLERALLYARCYHAHTPEEAVYLFLRSCRECSPVYRMAVMPEDEIPRYQEYAWAWFSGQDTEGYPAYFPQETGIAWKYRVYNLACDKERGSAKVYAVSREREGRTSREWRLELAYENGWKVWLAEEAAAGEGEYVPEPMLGGSGQIGDFRIEVCGYNEGYFNGLDTEGAGFFRYEDGQAAEEGFPQYFSTEYKWRRVQVFYLGEESLEGRTVKILTWDPAQNGEGSASWSLFGQDSQGNGSSVFDGGELTGGAPREIYGGGSGYSQPGYCWKEGDRIGACVQIYIDGELAEEGEVWSGEL
ncbi:M56 family metallopeptidase [uncultured Acetatifactor sp.]|uniref:M56 family metallopeptidase n=1 Tax=uncultured Acetatifactor sp. TaxID=1671927 RepID=UPI002620BCEA|nr:M56 family metallopeptidase [uncultured Acetatifactor sp.]